jgi:hypothetical protein
MALDPTDRMSGRPPMPKTGNVPRSDPLQEGNPPARWTSLYWGAVIVEDVFLLTVLVSFLVGVVLAEPVA